MSKYHKVAGDCPVCGGAMYGEYDTCELCGYEAPVVRKAKDCIKELMNTPFFSYHDLRLKPVTYCRVVPGKLYDAGDGLTYVME